MKKKFVVGDVVVLSLPRGDVTRRVVEVDTRDKDQPIKVRELSGNIEYWPFRGEIKKILTKRGILWYN